MIWWNSFSINGFNFNWLIKKILINYHQIEVKDYILIFFNTNRNGNIAFNFYRKCFSSYPANSNDSDTNIFNFTYFYYKNNTNGKVKFFNDDNGEKMFNSNYPQILNKRYLNNINIPASYSKDWETNHYEFKYHS